MRLSGVCDHIAGVDPGGAVTSAAGHECSTVPQVVHACLAALPGVDGAAVVVMTGPDARQTVYASDGVVAGMEDVQFSYGEGPCFQAFATDSPVLIADLRDARHLLRWPVYPQAVIDLGVGAVFALPITVGGHRLGLLDLYRTAAGPMVAGDVIIAGAYAAAAGNAVINIAALTTDPDADDAGVTHRDEVHQAVGFVVAQLGTTSGQALLRLRAHAYADGRTLQDVSHDIVTRRLRLSPDTACPN